MSWIVQLAVDTPNPEGLPDGWPVKKKTYEGTVPTGWQQMTTEELAAAKTALDTEYQAWKVAAEAAKEAQIAYEDLVNISFEDMPLKLPGLAWMVIENVGLTEEEKDIVILSDALNDFHRYVRNGFVARGVQNLNIAPVPSGVNSDKWAALLAQINLIIAGAS